MRQWPQRGWGQGVWGNNCKWHIHPRASPNNFGSSGWGPRVSTLSSLIALWGVICKYRSVMNLFSFPNPPCCLLNHLCSTWATTVSSTDALALRLWSCRKWAWFWADTVLLSCQSYILGSHWIFAFNCELLYFSNYQSLIFPHILLNT